MSIWGFPQDMKGMSLTKQTLLGRFLSIGLLLAHAGLIQGKGVKPMQVEKVASTQVAEKIWKGA